MPRRGRGRSRAKWTGVFSVSRTEAENTTLSETFDRYIVEYLPRLANLRRGKSRALALQKRSLASRFLASIRGKDIADFIKERKNEGTVPLSPAALAILREVLAEDGNNGWVFCISADAITQAMERARKAAGITKLTFHDLRHKAISRLFENTDLDVMEIKTISGHRSMQMLARYSHLRAHRLADRLAGARRGSGNVTS